MEGNTLNITIICLTIIALTAIGAGNNVTASEAIKTIRSLFASFNKSASKASDITK